jgi:hypothetical protein
MSARNELRDLIHRNLHQIEGFERWTFQAPVDLADALTAAGYRKPRTITTAEELDALPEGSVTLDRTGDVQKRTYEGWMSTGAEEPNYVALPATAIYEPEADK